MASVTYNALALNLVKGKIDFENDTFKMMLVTSAYTPDVDAHDYRNDVTNEVSGTGYTAGGMEIEVGTISQDNANNRIVVPLNPATWETVTISGARWGVIYKSRGGAASADELAFAVDFGADKSASGGDFTFNPTTPFYVNLPA